MDPNREKQDMKKQYTFHEYAWGCYVIELYHDGVMIQTIKKDKADMNRYIDRLEAHGYTFGYTDKDIEEAQKKYEHMLENKIERKKEE